MITSSVGSRPVGVAVATVTTFDAREIADDLDGGDSCELVTAVSAKLPLRVLADLLGMPRADHGLLHLVRGVFRNRDPVHRRRQHGDTARLPEF